MMESALKIADALAMGFGYVLLMCFIGSAIVNGAEALRKPVHIRLVIPNAPAAATSAPSV